VVDELHKVGIEIVSPSFMNQRQVNDTVFIPKHVKKVAPVPENKKPENIIFDKADQAEGIESRKKHIANIDEKLTALNAELKATESEEAKASIQKKIDTNTAMKQKLVEKIDTKLDEMSNKE